MLNKGISRRGFMKTTAGTVLAAQSVLLQPGPLATALGRPVAPSDRVRFGMIGVGMQGSWLLRTSTQLPGVECIAACDLYDGRQQLAKDLVGKPILTTRRYREVLDNKEVDCIVAAVPDHWHKQVIVDACNAGKDIYCEKPMTHLVGEGFEILAAEQRNKRIVQIGSQRRSSIVFAKAKELYEQGAIGEVCLVEAGMGRNEPCGAWVYEIPPDLSPETLDWETWLGTAPKRPFDPIRWGRWRCFRDYGEGIPGDLYVHLLTGIHYVLGVTAPPTQAFSDGGLFRWKDGRDVPDLMTTVYQYPSFRAAFRVTLNTGTGEYTRFLGSRGSIDIGGDESLSISLQHGLNEGPCTPAWPLKLKAAYAEKYHNEHDLKVAEGKLISNQNTSFSIPPGYDSTREHLWNFFQSVRTRRSSVEDSSFGNRTAIACHMANYSYFNKTVAVWDSGANDIKSRG